MTETTPTIPSATGNTNADTALPESAHTTDDRIGYDGQPPDDLPPREAQIQPLTIASTTGWCTSADYTDPSFLDPFNFDELQQEAKPWSGTMLNAALCCKINTDDTAIARTTLLPSLMANEWSLPPTRIRHLVNGYTLTTTRLAVPALLSEHWTLIMVDIRARTVTALMEPGIYANKQHTIHENIKIPLEMLTLKIETILCQLHRKTEIPKRLLPRYELLNILSVWHQQPLTERRRWLLANLANRRFAHPTLGVISLQQSSTTTNPLGVFVHSSTYTTKETKLLPSIAHETQPDCSVCHPDGRPNTDARRVLNYCPSCGDPALTLNNLTWFATNSRAASSASRWSAAAKDMLALRHTHPLDTSSETQHELTAHRPSSFKTKVLKAPATKAWTHDTTAHELPHRRGDCGPVIVALLSSDTTRIITRREIAATMLNHPFTASQDRLTSINTPTPLYPPWLTPIDTADTLPTHKDDTTGRTVTLMLNPVRTIPVHSNELLLLRDDAEFTVNLAEVWVQRLNKAQPHTTLIGPAWSEHIHRGTPAPLPLPVAAPESLATMVQLNPHVWTIVKLSPNATASERITIWHCIDEPSPITYQNVRLLTQPILELSRRWPQYRSLILPRTISTIMHHLQNMQSLTEAVAALTDIALNQNRLPSNVLLNSYQRRRWHANSCLKYIQEFSPDSQYTNAVSIHCWQPSDNRPQPMALPNNATKKHIHKPTAISTLVHRHIAELWGSTARIKSCIGPANDHTVTLYNADTTGQQLSCPLSNSLGAPHDRDAIFLHCDGTQLSLHCQQCKPGKMPLVNYKEFIADRRSRGTQNLQRHRAQQHADKLARDLHAESVDPTEIDKITEDSVAFLEAWKAKKGRRKHQTNDPRWFGTDPRSVNWSPVVLNAATLNMNRGLRAGLKSPEWHRPIQMMTKRKLNAMIITESGMPSQARNKANKHNPRIRLDTVAHVFGHKYTAFYSPAVPFVEEGETRYRGGVIVILCNALANTVVRTKIAERHVLLQLHSEQQTEPLILGGHYHNSSPLSNSQASADTAKSLHTDVAELKHDFPTAPVLIGGDFNIAPNPDIDRGSDTSRTPNNVATERSRWKHITQPPGDPQPPPYADLFRTQFPTAQAYTYAKPYKERMTLSRIDHFIGCDRAVAALIAIGIEQYSSYASDHWPVFAKFQLPPLLNMSKHTTRGPKTEDRLRYVLPPQPSRTRPRSKGDSDTRDDELDIDWQSPYLRHDHDTHVLDHTEIDSTEQILSQEQRRLLWEPAIDAMETEYTRISTAPPSADTQLILTSLGDLDKPTQATEAEWRHDQSIRVRQALDFAHVVQPIKAAIEQQPKPGQPYWKPRTQAHKPPASVHFHNVNKRLRILKSLSTAHAALAIWPYNTAATVAAKRHSKKLTKYFPDIHTPTARATPRQHADFGTLCRTRHTELRKQLKQKHGTTDSNQIQQAIKRRNIRFDMHQSPKDVAKVLDSLLRRKEPAVQSEGVWITDEEGNRRFSTRYATIREFYHDLFYKWTSSPTYKQFPECRLKPHVIRYHPRHYPAPPSNTTTRIRALMDEVHEPTDGRFDNLMNPLTEEEWVQHWRILGPKMQTAPGGTGISFPLLKLAPNNIQTTLRRIIDTALTEQIIPEQVREAVLFGAPKEGSDDPGNVRPISMVEPILKLITQTIASRLNHIAYSTRNASRPLFRNNQAGFRKGPGCMGPLTYLQQCIEHANHTKNALHVISADMRRAFDYAEHWSIQACYRRAGLPPNFCRLMAELAAGNTTRIDTIGGLTDPVNIERGTRQGETLSPLNWLFLIDPLIELLERVNESKGYTITPENKVHTMVYADDILLLGTSSTNVNESFDVCREYMAYHECYYHPGKTIYSCINPAKLDPCEPPYIATPYWAPEDSGPAKKIPPTEAFRYLGMWFALDGSWKKQIEVIDQAINALSGGLSHTLASATPEQCRFVVQSVVIPKLAYPLTLANIPESNINRWEVKIRALLRAGLKTARSMNTGALYAPKAQCGLNAPSLSNTVDAQLITLAISSLNSEVNQNAPMVRPILICASQRLRRLRALSTCPWEAPHSRFGHETLSLASRITSALHRSRLAIHTQAQFHQTETMPPRHLQCVLPNFGEIGKDLTKRGVRNAHQIIDPTTRTVLPWSTLHRKFPNLGHDEPKHYNTITNQLTDERGIVHDWLCEDASLKQGDFIILRQLETGPQQSAAAPHHIWQSITDPLDEPMGFTVEARLWYRQSSHDTATSHFYAESCIETKITINEHDKYVRLTPNSYKLTTADRGKTATEKATKNCEGRLYAYADNNNQIQWRPLPEAPPNYPSDLLLATPRSPVPAPLIPPLPPHTPAKSARRLGPCLRTDPDTPSAWLSLHHRPIEIPIRLGKQPAWSDWLPQDTRADDELFCTSPELQQLDHIIVATDGSFYPTSGEAGAAAVFFANDTEVKLTAVPIQDEEASANMAETVALLLALQEQPSIPMTIKTDCQSVIDAYNYNRDPTPNELARMTAKGLWNRIRKLKAERERRGGTATLVKVAAHKDKSDVNYCPKNDRADQAAKAAALLEQSDPTQYANTVWRNTELARDSGLSVLARQGPLPGTVHSFVLGDTRKAVEKQRRNAAVVYWEDCESQGASRRPTNADIKLTGAVRNSTPAHPFYTKLHTRSLPVMNALTRNYHEAPDEHTPTCTLCASETEHSDHILTCKGNAVGHGLHQAAIADIIAEKYAADDGPIPINNWLTGAMFTSSMKEHGIVLTRIPSNPYKTDAAPQVAMSGTDTHIRETTLWERLNNNPTIQHRLIEEWEAFIARDGQTTPHSILRTLQRNLHFDAQMSRSKFGAYPGVTQHSDISISALPKEGSHMTIITLESPPSPEEMDEIEKMGTVTMQPAEHARRLIVLAAGPHTQWEHTTSSTLATFPANTMPLHAVEYHKGNTNASRSSTNEWSLITWENLEASQRCPIPSTIRKQVDAWFSRHNTATAAQNIAAGPRALTPTWAPSLSNNTHKRERATCFQDQPLHSPLQATPWRLLPLTLLGWLPPAHEGLYAKAHGAAAAAWCESAETTSKLPTTCEIIKGVVPEQAAQILQHYLHLSGEKDAHHNQAEALAKQMALAAITAVRHITWKRRNVKHHAAVHSREELQWLRNARWRRGHTRTKATAIAASPPDTTSEQTSSSTHESNARGSKTWVQHSSDSEPTARTKGKPTDLRLLHKFRPPAIATHPLKRPINPPPHAIMERPWPNGNATNKELNSANNTSRTRRKAVRKVGKPTFADTSTQTEQVVPDSPRTQRRTTSALKRKRGQPRRRINKETQTTSDGPEVTTPAAPPTISATPQANAITAYYKTANKTQTPSNPAPPPEPPKPPDPATPTPAHGCWGKGKQAASSGVCKCAACRKQNTRHR
jgi:ribonuclease HI